MRGASASTIYGDLDVEIELNAPIGGRSWFATGGTADTLVHPKSIDALQQIVRRCRHTATSLRVMGEGANLLVSESGVEGIVVRLDSPAFQSAEFNADGRLDRMKVGAGADMSKILMEATRRGLKGLSQMAGIPASIGGAIRMNAGGAYGSIGDAVDAVACIDAHGEYKVYPAEELRFEYRETNIIDPIVLWSVFRVEPSDPIALRQEVKEIFAYKKSTQPMGEKTAGCMFKNPVIDGERMSAGKIIDETGLKGLSHGSAEVSLLHANFITIERGGKADDAIALSDELIKRVRDARSIDLVREIAVWQREDEA